MDMEIWVWDGGQGLEGGKGQGNKGIRRGSKGEK